jgi:hypoxanthine phosphoribosyltransferase
MSFWPYYILRRDDEGIREDLRSIMNHFEGRNERWDIVVFIPNAGLYLADRFREIFSNAYPIGFVTIRRSSTTRKDRAAFSVIYRHRWLSDLLRHLEVLIRLWKMRFHIAHKRTVQQEMDFEVRGKSILVIDDSVDTGTTLAIIRQNLLERGAVRVQTACVSNHLRPDIVPVDYSVYQYALLRTKNSRDYHAQ